MKLFYATTNTSKIYNMKRRLEGKAIEIVTPEDLAIDLEIEEDGTTPIENARKKAAAYAGKIDMPIIAGDSGLHLEGVENEDQPGIFVRRVNGKTLSNEEMIIHYSGLAKKYGGSLKAYYVTGLALINGEEEHTIEIPDDEFILTSVSNENKFHRGNPLDVITIEPKSGKYYNELMDEEFRSLAWSFDEMCLKFLKKYLL